MGRKADRRRHSLELHKQEAFQGMRAYHASEIQHKQDAIAIMKAALTSVITVDGAMLAALATQKVHPSVTILGTLLVLLAACLALSELSEITNNKIAKDHRRYEDYRDDYVRALVSLGLQDAQSHWHRQEDRDRSGYAATQKIVKVFENIVVGVAAVGFAFALMLYGFQ